MVRRRKKTGYSNNARTSQRSDIQEHPINYGYRRNYGRRINTYRYIRPNRPIERYLYVVNTRPRRILKSLTRMSQIHREQRFKRKLNFILQSKIRDNRHIKVNKCQYNKRVARHMAIKNLQSGRSNNHENNRKAKRCS